MTPQVAREPSSTHCQIYEPFYVYSTFQHDGDGYGIDRNSQRLKILEEKGYSVVAGPEGNVSQASYLDVLHEGDFGILTTAGAYVDGGYSSLLLVSRINGRLEIVAHLSNLTSGRDSTITKLFSQIPNCGK